MTVYSNTKLNPEAVFENSKTDRLSYGKAMVKSLIIGLLLVFLSNLAAANTNLISLLSTSESSFVLHLPEASKTHSHVLLKDTKGQILHNEIISAGTEIRQFNLKNLPSGEYVISITNDKTTKWQHIHKVGGVLNVNEENFQTISQPVLRFQDGYLDLNMLCFSNSHINLKIWDEAGNILIQEKLEAEGNVQRRYNLKGLEEGHYQISVGLEYAHVDFEFDQTIHWTPEQTEQYSSK